MASLLLLLLPRSEAVARKLRRRMMKRRPSP
jgi:hypothetical protein